VTSDGAGLPLAPLTVVEKLGYVMAIVRERA
jgi:hypothetical protein